MNKIQDFNPNKTSNRNFIFLEIILFIFGLVAVFFSGRLIFGIYKIHRFKKQFPKEYFKGINFYQTNMDEAPFSYFKNLFWKNSILIHSDLGRQILKHEMVHIEQRHSFDKIFTEIITSIFWLNPFFHLIKKEINLIHEYLADKKAVKNRDAEAFARMLLAGSFSGKILPATSPFISSNLKKRLKMLQKSKTKFGYARKIFALPLLFILLFAYLVKAKNREIANTNRNIEKIVNALKTDTLKMETKNSDTLKIGKTQKNAEIAEKNGEIARKNAEIAEKNGEIARKNGEEAQKNGEIAEKNAEQNQLENLKWFDSAEFKKLSEESKRQVEEHKKQMEYLKKQSDDFKKQSAEFDKLINSESFKKQSAEFEKQINSKEFQEKIQEAKKRAEEAVKEAVKAQTDLVNAQTSKIYLTDPQIVYLPKSENVKIYLNDKLISKQEMDQLNPNNIASVIVNKADADGKQENVISIRTK
jgi:uncharacterized membrane protein YphA (DoxX/SURF4 family)